VLSSVDKRSGNWGIQSDFPCSEGPFSNRAFVVTMNSASPARVSCRTRRAPPTSPGWVNLVTAQEPIEEHRNFAVYFARFWQDWADEKLGV
jgi:hypothetical protein